MSGAFSQNQFLNVVDRDEAERRFQRHLDLSQFPAEEVLLANCLGRVLATAIISPMDIPGFDRANVDGFAVKAEDTFGASEDAPVTVGHFHAIPTGGMVPRGYTAVVMVEHTKPAASGIQVTRPVAPGVNITFAGADIAQGELVLAKGTRITSREAGVLAALGMETVAVVKKPRVAIVSTGDELRAPGDALPLGCVFDSNATVLAGAVEELGGVAVPLGIVKDDETALRKVLQEAMTCDAVLLSGGTSKGPGDLSYRIVAELGQPGVVVHGVALKPGKPLCLAVVKQENNKRAIPVAVLPGFPTSALFTFHEFIAPVLAAWAGFTHTARETVSAILPRRMNAERGRTEYVLAGLLPQDEGPPVAIPLGKGSGSVSAFALADGFFTIPRHIEYLEAGATVEVKLLGAGSRAADLVVVGSHCPRQDLLLEKVRERGYTTRSFAVGSTAGLEAVSRGECDAAGVHLLDARTGTYNRAYVPPGVELVPGYTRWQGLVFRPGDNRFEGRSWEEVLQRVCEDETCLLANRNRGSGTRVLLDSLLKGVQPPGYLAEGKTHAGVAAAVAQGRADWGLAIQTVALGAGLGFIPVQEEHFDFLVPLKRMDRPAVRVFLELLKAQK